MRTAVVSQPIDSADRVGGTVGYRGGCRSAGALPTRSRARSDQSRRACWAAVGGLRVVHRASLNLLVVHGLTVLAMLLGLVLADGRVATTPTLVSGVNGAEPKDYAATNHEPANPAAAFMSLDDDEPKEGLASAMASMGGEPTPRSGIPAVLPMPTGYVGNLIAEGLVAGAGSAGTAGEASGSAASGGVLAILLALSVMVFPGLPRHVCVEYLGRLTWMFSRPLVRPG
jgi:hypothetical protein